MPPTVKDILGDANLQPEVYGPLPGALTDDPKSVRELDANRGVAALDWARMTQAFTILVVARAQDNADLQFLASPVTGGGIAVGRFQQLFLSALWKGKKTPTEWAEAAWAVIAAQGQRLVKDGKTLESEAENKAELTAQAEGFAEKQLPVLKSLGI